MNRFLALYVLVAVLSCVNAHGVWSRWALSCPTGGTYPDKLVVMLVQDYGPYAEMSTVGVPGGNPPNYGFKFGGTPSCPSNFRWPYQAGFSDCWHCSGNSGTECPGYTRPETVSFGMDPKWNPPGLVYIPFSITVRPDWQACKESANPVNCGNPYDVVPGIKAKVWWGWSRNSPTRLNGTNSPPTYFTTSSVQITDADVAGARCPQDQMVCPNPPQDSCSIGACPDRCNKFTVLKVQTVSGTTTFRINVTNECADPFYYAAFSVVTSGTSVTMSGANPSLKFVSPAVGSTYQGTNYAWSISQVDGSAAATQTTPPALWLRFVSKGTSSQYPQFSNSTTKNWEVFEFQMTGWDLGLPLIVQGHQGGKWDTFNSLDVSSCLCTDCDTTVTNGCPDGYTGTDCTQCDQNPLPGGYTWFCLNNGNSVQPWELHKIPNRVLGTGSWTVPPGFIPSAGNGLNVDSDGYLINCDCSRKIHDCSPLQYCSGHGTCVPQNGTCICDQGFLGPDCSPPTTTPAITTTPAGTTTSPAPTTTAPGQTFQTSPPTTTPTASNPPCFNNGKFCTGHGSCDGTSCVCVDNYSGPDCSILTTTTTEHFCSEASTCETCDTFGAQYGLNCSWCADIIGGGCVASSVCQNVGSCGGESVSFVAESCPDDCSGSKHGVCVNQTCQEMEAAGLKVEKVNGIPACINHTVEVQVDDTNNATSTVNNSISFCLCHKGYRGSNCGSKSSGLAKALAISGGVIAAIVIAGVIIIVIVAFGAKKGVDFVMLNQQAEANFKNNPLEKSKSGTYDNPLRDA